MTRLTFHKNYKNNEQLRNSFNELATLVFGLNFEDWYKMGYWNERYLPFSYADGTKIISNVSVNLLDFVIDGEKKSAIQIGTVMTHPDYRNQGLAASLMNKVLEEFENDYDYMYLFANKQVVDFYPKFGFESVEQQLFSMTYTPNHLEPAHMVKLDPGKINDLHFIYKMASERLPVSNLFGTLSSQGILMFHCMYVFSKDIYYIAEDEAIVIYKIEGAQLHIYDIVSQKDIRIDNILATISQGDTDKIIFHYTPSYTGIEIQANVYNDGEVLFVKSSNENIFPVNMKHPVTSQA
ncbi:GNAT family N-acetyltransferase [Gracilibacillus oryzae]|uniref:GNAT family N-acetyltransferase n=1 Tax=Gracilibacillus oryzae TaxID=1672701 RepID=A0A7C8GTD6_9BACI|nr:GNAT family N-acetyltransferase [Gracilibacillus oryzae]KAB8135746.1 GNAT family N-acetyltransferase [Gracilibacillus oryzae]